MSYSGMPQTLLNFTSPIVETALKTGARGSTTTVTNYGVIGDAMFKKAQLDLGIANLQADMGAERARIMGGLEMNKAEMNMGMVKARMDYDVKLRDLREQLKANEVGPFEAIFGTITGAVTGAVAGTIMGGPGVGTVAGAAIGGAATLGGYAAEGKRGGNAAKEMLGTVANGASIIKGIGQQKSGQDAWKGILEAGQGILNVLNDPSAPPEVRQKAEMQWNNHLGDLYRTQTTAMGVNPEQAAKSVQDYSKALRGFDSADPTAKWNFNSAKRGVEAMANPAFDNPATARQARKEFLANSALDYANSFAGKEMPASVGAALLERSGINQRSGLMDMQPQQKPKGNTTTQPINPARGQPVPQENLKTNDLVIEPIKSPQKGRAVQQAPRGLVIERIGEAPGQAWHPPMASGAGVQYDDGQPALTSPEAVAPLTKQGTETAKILQKEVDAMGEPTTREKIFGGIPGLGTAKHRERVKLQNEIAAEEEHAKTMAGASDQVRRDDAVFEARQKRDAQDREALNPGVKEARNAERVKLETIAPKLAELPEQDMTQRNRKQGLRDAVASAQHLDDLMEKIPDDVITAFNEFVQSEGVGIKSPHISVDVLDEVGKAMASEGAKAKFTPKERDLLDEYRMELYNLAYADALMDAGGHGVKNEQLRMSKPQMPGFADDYRKRSNKLRLLMRGYEERIADATKEGNVSREEEKLDLEYKRARNAKMMKGPAPKAEAKKKKTNGWLDLLD